MKREVQGALRSPVVHQETKDEVGLEAILAEGGSSGKGPELAL